MRILPRGAAVSHRGQAGWRGTEPVRAFGWRVYGCFRFCRGGFLGGEPLRASIFGKVPFRHVRIRSRSMAEPPQASGLGLRRSVTSVFPSGRLPRRYAPRNDSGVKSVRLVCYPCSGVIVSAAGDFSAVIHRGRAGWRVFVSDISLPGDCHVADACPARSIATSPLWLKTVT